MGVSTNYILGVFTLVILGIQAYILFQQTKIGKEQNKISGEQAQILKNQLILDNRREHTVEIKNKIILKLRHYIESIFLFHSNPEPQNAIKKENNFIVDHNLSLTTENFFKELDVGSPNHNSNDNNLYQDFLENHLGEHKDSFLKNFELFIKYNNMYLSEITCIEEEFKNKFYDFKKNKNIDNKTIQIAFNRKNDFEPVIYSIIDNNGVKREKMSNISIGLFQAIFCFWIKDLEIEYISHCDKPKYGSIYNSLYLEDSNTAENFLEKFRIVQISDLVNINNGFFIHEEDYGGEYPYKLHGSYVITDFEQFYAIGSESDLETLLNISEGLLKYRENENNDKKFKETVKKIMDYRNKIDELKSFLSGILSKIDEQIVLKGICNFVDIK